eukprot:jgi/Bigna1/58209/fgenesh1_pm.64_\
MNDERIISNDAVEMIKGGGANSSVPSVFNRKCKSVGVSTVARMHQAGTQKEEDPIPMTIQNCDENGQCTDQKMSVTLDANWRWLHKTGTYTNCYTGTSWDSSICPDPDTCSNNCALEGVPTSDALNTYGIKSDGKNLNLKFVTKGQYASNIGSRTYLTNGDKYYMFKLKNREFTFDVDVSNLPCGLNGALYFVEMEEDAGQSKYSLNKAGAKYGTGYCDAQCPHDLKFINGEANVLDWNAGVGHYGTCCAEMDIWESNKAASAYTAHTCSKPGQIRCEGTDCGDGGERYKGLCDKDGCDFNSYRMGDKDFFGEGPSFAVDTTQPFTVVTQFLTTDGTDSGDLSEIRRLYVQNGKVIPLRNATLDKLSQYNSISDDFCASQKDLFNDTNAFAEKGGLKAMGETLDRGMVLVMSLWDDHAVNMLWLDSSYPTDVDPSTPGVTRGPCSTDSGKPEDVESKYPDSSVSYGSIKYGAIGSTYPVSVIADECGCIQPR